MESRRRRAIDAVVRTGGKQYRVHEGTVLDVATLAVEPGSRVELRDVLLVSDGDKITVGNPNVADALVVAEVVAHGKGKKVINFKYKAKTRYRRKRGHRQPFTKLAVREIRIGDALVTEVQAAAPGQEARAPSDAEAAAAVEEPAAEVPLTEEPIEDAPAVAPARRRRRPSESETLE